MAARGGAGGHGNHYFLSNEERAPTVYEEGARGQEQLLFAEMRVIAHVGLVRYLVVLLLGATALCRDESHCSRRPRKISSCSLIRSNYSLPR